MAERADDDPAIRYHRNVSSGDMLRTVSVGESSIAAACFVALLIFSGCLWIWTDRSLYGDGSNLLLAIIRTRTFFHVSTTRISSTFMTQLPVVLAIGAGVRSIPLLTMLYTFGMAAVPVACYSAALWISRRDPLLFSATAVIILGCFYPMSFLLVSEANIYLALFWLSFVLLLYGKIESPGFAVALLLLSAAAIKAYETSVFFSLLLAILCVFRLGTTRMWVIRSSVFLAALLFLAGAWFGFSGAFFPRDATNEAGFASAIPGFWENGAYEGILLLTALAVASAFAPDRRLRIGIAAMTALGFAFFAYSRLRMPALLSLGYPLAQRAQAFIVLGGVTSLVLLAKFFGSRSAAPTRFHAIAFAVPLVAIVALDSYDSLGMRTYLVGACTQLQAQGPGPDLHFVKTAAARKFGWNWTFPIVSILIRSPTSRKLLTDPDYHGWIPFDPKQPLPEIDAFKTDGTFCGA